MNANDKQHRAVLQNIAQRAMLERGLLPDFSAEALAELDRIQSPATMNNEPVRDLRDLLWVSVDNDDSRDLDQLTLAESLPGNKIKIFVAVADVDALVKKVVSGIVCKQRTSSNRKPVFEADRQLVENDRPVGDRHRPFLDNITVGQPQQLASGLG